MSIAARNLRPDRARFAIGITPVGYQVSTRRLQVAVRGVSDTLRESDTFTVALAASFRHRAWHVWCLTPEGCQTPIRPRRRSIRLGAEPFHGQGQRPGQ